ncbi:MAG TPA: chemotaxis protein CheD [Candidatus Sulfotelmatobacter sp.]|nr:chemotaxis protein CheD [Candidatus Sulfotelmatobacter sp.]
MSGAKQPLPLSVVANLALGGPAIGNRTKTYLLPGQLYVSAEPCQIRTILGSCVAICLWDKWRGAGGMNHFLLPSSREGQPASLRYGDEATRVLLELLDGLGCQAPNLCAKIFGGAALFQSRNRYGVSLGAKNVAAALSLMKSSGIPVVAQETGGLQGRRLIFNTGDGIAWSQKI